MSEKTKNNWKEKLITTGSIFALGSILLVLNPTSFFNNLLCVASFVTFAVSIPLTLASEGMI